MRERRAAGQAWIDPAKEAERKAAWYQLQGGKEKLDAARKNRKQREREQGITDFVRKINDQ